MAKQYQHWRQETDDDRITWLYADKANESTNSLSKEMLDELADIVGELEDSTSRGLVILSAKKNGFIAGADINTIAQAKTTEQAAEFIRHGQSIFNRIEKLRFPTVCVIHGFCMGGGYELALACRYRIALDDPGTKLGLPEIKLGIHPGFGGVMRLPLLIGAPAAMDIMLSGRAVSARSAKKMGMIDYLVAERHLRKAAIDLINTKPPHHRLRGWKTLTNHAFARPLLASYLRKQVATKAPKKHYPAPYALIDIWEKHAGNRNRMLKAEEDSLSNLVVGETAQNLIRVFFLQNKLKAIGDKKLFSPKRVHVVGAGVMGGDIAAWCALQGFQVTVQDRQEKNIARVIQNAYKLYSKKLKDRLLIQAALDRLIPDIHGLGLPHADVIIEAIFEDKDAKHALFREIEPKIKPDALLATNTSSIPLETLGEALADPGRLVGVHFFNPVAMMQLVEIVSAGNTRQEVMNKAAAFTRHINRLPLPVKSSPGFLVNRVLMPYLVEAVVLEAEGIGAPVIDNAATDFGMPMGPIALADTVGLDICLSVAENLSGTTSVEVPQRLKTLVHDGHLGRKSNRGFYHYKNGKPIDAKVGKADYSPADIQDRLMLRFINEAVACLREGVVTDKDLLDAGIIFGTGFAPFRGGPMHYRDQQGATALYRKLVELEEKYGNRFKPDAAWKPDKEPQLKVVRDYAGNEL
ncbi:3-hydroxyacyl-CoA dehydrogenase NAD-binding domain-containing protein [Kaarinaea lacus]